MNGEKRPPVGVDFGTSTTLIASAEGIVPIGSSSPSMPSLVGYGDDGSFIVGEEAADATTTQQVVASIKRSITERREFVRVDTPTGTRDVRADDLMVEVLREAARRGAYQGQVLTSDGGLRLGCPAMWDGQQRRRLLTIAQRAGLSVSLANLVDEPVAAGIAWFAAADVDASRPLRVVVFDMGGGTLDIAVLEVCGNEISVLAALGVGEAGDALDAAIADDLEYAFASMTAGRGAEWAYLIKAARDAKVGLSAEERFPVVHRSNEVWYTRGQLEDVFQAQMERAELAVAAALRAAQLTESGSQTAYDLARTPMESLVEGVDVVVLSGGMSQIPYVWERLRWLFPEPTRIEAAATPPEHAVALGLAKAAQVGRINRYRPAFDILLEWDRGGECRIVYDAFTPLVEAWQISQGGGDLRYVRNGLELALPRDGKGRLRLVSHSGERVRASLGGNSLDGFPVALSEQKFEFSLYPNGRIRLADAAGTYDGQVEDWQSR